MKIAFFISMMMKVYLDDQSGNCYKVQLTAALLDMKLDWVAVDIMQGATQKAAFLAKNPNGKIPLLELADGQYLSESNAIINYLSLGTKLLPSEPWAFGQVQQWQFFEQYSHEPYIAVARFINKYLGLPAEQKQNYADKQSGGHKALQVMQQQLSKTPYLVGEQLTVADISLFAYTHVAPEGGFDLAGYPAIVDWIARVEKLPGFCPMGN